MNESLRWLGSIGCLALVACGAGAGEGSTEDGVLRDSLGKELSPISAQIVRANPSSEVGAALLARLEVQPNELVEFHELEPGVLAISGSGRPSSAPRGEGTADSLSDVRAVWAALSANAAMPEA